MSDALARLLLAGTTALAAAAAFEAGMHAEGAPAEAQWAAVVRRWDADFATRRERKLRALVASEAAYFIGTMSSSFGRFALMLGAARTGRFAPHAPRLQLVVWTRQLLLLLVRGLRV